LQADGVEGVSDLDQRKVVRREMASLYSASRGADGLDFFRLEGEKLAKLSDGADGVLRLPAPIVPLFLGDVAPEEGWRPGLTGRLFFFVSVFLYLADALRVEPGTPLPFRFIKSGSSK